MEKTSNSTTTDLRTLYPEIEPTNTFFLEVGEDHHLYVEESGNPEGIPVLFLHGGPGSGTKPKQRRFFNPDKYRIILFDQRGCGQSKYKESTHANTTQHLVEDIERIRIKLNIKTWLIFGGSWGSTLALAYGQAYPHTLQGMILRGIFTARTSEEDWLYKPEGAAQFFPQEYEQFRSFMPQEEQGHLAKAYAKRLHDTDPKVHLPAAEKWSAWEYMLCQFDANPVLEPLPPEFILPFARIETHYFSNDSFLQPDQLIHNLHKIKGVPIHLFQGRFDIVCPPVTAWEVYKALPLSTLTFVDAGHTSGDPAMTSALIHATDAFGGSL